MIQYVRRVLERVDVWLNEGLHLGEGLISRASLTFILGIIFGLGHIFRETQYLSLLHHYLVSMLVHISVILYNYSVRWRLSLISFPLFSFYFAYSLLSVFFKKYFSHETWKQRLHEVKWMSITETYFFKYSSESMLVLFCPFLLQSNNPSLNCRLFVKILYCFLIFSAFVQLFCLFELGFFFFFLFLVFIVNVFFFFFCSSLIFLFIENWNCQKD